MKPILINFAADWYSIFKGVDLRVEKPNVRFQPMAKGRLLNCR